MRQLLAGMIAEPAFLSEYTVFALDSSKQPISQTDSVVSPSTLSAFPLKGSKVICNSRSRSLFTYDLLSLKASLVPCC